MLNSLYQFLSALRGGTDLREDSLRFRMIVAVAGLSQSLCQLHHGASEPAEIAYERACSEFPIRRIGRLRPYGRLLSLRGGHGELTTSKGAKPFGHAFALGLCSRFGALCQDVVHADQHLVSQLANIAHDASAPGRSTEGLAPPGQVEVAAQSADIRHAWLIRESVADVQA